MPRNTSLTDTRLVRRSQQGDRRAFRALLTRYDWRLRGLAHALLLDPGRVDAVLRVAYVKAWREVVRIDPREDAAAWLYRVVYNACIDGLRRESNRIGAAPPTVADVPDAVDEVADPPAQPMPAGGNGASSATADGRRARVVEALATLAPADRVAVVLVDREGFARESAARILGLTPDEVEARLAGARARLAHLLANAAVAPTEEAKPQPEDAEPQPEAPEAPEESASQPEPPDPQPEAPEPQPEGPEPQPEGPEAPAEQPDIELEAPAEQPDIELDDTTSADPADTKVGSRSIAGGSSNGASGGGSTNGSDDGGGSGQ